MKATVVAPNTNFAAHKNETTVNDLQMALIAFRNAIGPPTTLAITKLRTESATFQHKVYLSGAAIHGYEANDCDTPNNKSF